eukprot:344967_1
MNHINNEDEEKQIMYERNEGNYGYHESIATINVLNNSPSSLISENNNNINHFIMNINNIACGNEGCEWFGSVNNLEFHKENECEFTSAEYWKSKYNNLLLKTTTT